ncbi:MAG: response regulator transcription factor [Candidatus Omnitrophica bacterium]|nr:response regulator transcription factor [Candidatus Omnitrophota bacterium]MDD5351566.1 response regulator transcription factor [Candidatus Omnitrophota bacterium]MDD5551001.1 response regulator transcription factor [Candidatus Omnitrophota bacterium]
MIAKKKILVVDDEKELVKLLAFNLSIAGYDVISAKSGIEALEICENEKPSLIILDIMLPRIDGWEVCRRLKQNTRTRHIPIIMLSALSEVDDKLKGFYLGIDDYITKPFSPRELVVRIKRVLVRIESRSNTAKRIRAGSSEIDLEGSLVKRNNQEMLLTEKEKGILEFFVNNPGRILSHSEILDAVWGQDNIVEYGNVDVHISHLREKIEKDPEDPQFIKTIKGEGYKFEPFPHV